jgi:hypothetical protein
LGSSFSAPPPQERPDLGSVPSFPTRNDEGQALLSYMAMSTAAIQKALERDDSILEGGGSTGSGFKSYMAGEKDMKDKPVEFVRNWYANAKREVHHHEGEVFSLPIYMRATRREKLGEHSTLWRMMVMMAETEQMFCEGKVALARAQNLANWRATHRATQHDGHWREAWQLAYLPDLRESESGTSVAERLSIGKYLKEMASLEELLEKERARGGNKGKKK